MIDSGLDQLPSWLPDETVYSWACRFHRLAGHRLPSQTSRVLFGGDRRGAQHDLPNGLALLAERTQGRLGIARGIALTRTVLRYYLIARPESALRSALDAMAGATALGLKFRLGMLTSRFRANHPLKACPACMAEDRAAYAVSYWHLAHQYPGVWVCRRHGVLLHAASMKSNGVARFAWVLPDAAGLEPVFSGDMDTAAFARLAGLVEGWVSLPPASLSVKDIAEACRRRLSHSPRTAGPPTTRGYLAEKFATALSALRVVPELAALPADAAAARAELDRWLFAPRGNTHPLRLLALVGWLFDDWRAFQDELACTESILPPAPTVAMPVAPSEAERRFAEALAAGASVTAAAKVAGVAVNTGIAWAARLGLRAPRRPKQLDEATHRKILKALRRGDDKAVVAARYAVSVQTVTRALRNEPGLAAERRGAMLQRDRSCARAQWSAALLRWPAMGQKDLRHRVGAAFAWLYRHDRDWLMSNQPVDPLRRQPSPRVDWDARDTMLASAVRRMACELTSSGVALPIPLWRLAQALPDLKAKIAALDRLPLTREALRAVTARPPRKTSSELL
jgi:transposase